MDHRRVSTRAGGMDGMVQREQNMLITVHIPMRILDRKLAKKVMEILGTTFRTLTIPNTGVHMTMYTSISQHGEKG